MWHVAVAAYFFHDSLLCATGTFVADHSIIHKLQLNFIYTISC